MYELANSFRHGWGVEKDAVAARSYYETAANLGDTDAMNEVARMYEEGDGGKKDKVSSTTLITTIHGETFRGFEPLDTKTIFRSGNLSIVSPLLSLQPFTRHTFEAPKPSDAETNLAPKALQSSPLLSSHTFPSRLNNPNLTPLPSTTLSPP